MGKRLPYFQFEPAEYITGDIQFCSLGAQGLFINICSMYWQKECILTTDQITKKFPNTEKELEELVSEGIINHGYELIISFLDEQYELITKRKKQLSDAGKKGAQVKKSQATLKPPLSQAEATLKQPDKIIEDNIREDDITTEEQNNIVKVYEMYPSACPYKGVLLKPQEDRVEIKRLILKHLRERGELVKVTQPIAVYLRGKTRSKGWHEPFKDFLLDLPEYHKVLDRVPL